MSFIHKIKNNNLLKDSFWSLMGNTIGKGLSLVAGVLIARYLGKDLFGEYSVIKSTLLTIGIFSSFGLGYTATKFVAELKKESPEKITAFTRYAFNITLVFCSMMAFFLLVFANFIADTFLEAPHLTLSLRILAIIIIFNGLTITQIGIIAGLGEFKNLAQVNIIVGLVTFTTSVFLTYYFLLNGALLALLISQVFNFIANKYLIRKLIPQSKSNISIDKNLLRDIFKFSTPIALQEMVYSVYSFTSNILIIHFSTYGDLGMYNAALQWNAIILFIPGILRNVVLSHLASNNNDKVAHEKILKTTVLINIFSTLTPAIIIFIFSNFIQGFYGSSFYGLSILISIAVFSTVFISVSNVYAQAYMSKGKNWLMFFIRLVRDGGILLLFVILFYKTKLSGSQAMISSLFVSNCVFLVLMVLIYKRIRWKY